MHPYYVGIMMLIKHIKVGLSHIKYLLIFLLHLLAHPLEWLVKKTISFKQQHVKIFSFIFGVSLILVGLFLSNINQHYISKRILELTVTFTHGVGAAPIIKMICDWIKVEI